MADYELRSKGMEQAQIALSIFMRGVNTESEEMFYVMLAAVSAQTKPFVPVDTSALINSEFRFVESSANGPIATIGFGAPGGTGGARGTPVQEYAVYVHDGPQKNWQKAGASNEYLSKGVKAFLAEDFEDIVARFTQGGSQ